MKAPLSWLKKYTHLTQSPAEIAEVLTLAGLEVEKIDRETFSFEGVVVGKLIEVTPHPDAEKLKVAVVSDGKKEFQVVCGDTTISEGLVVAFAKTGARLTLAEGEVLEIEKAKLRGVESSGMLCSGRELGISDEEDKIYRLPSDAPLGQDLSEYLYDPIFDICTTPNLGHCRSFFGIARELSAHFNQPIKIPKVTLDEDQDNPAKSYVQVTNEDHDGCYQYECRVIRGVEIKESPSWLIDVLEKTGHSIINNVVDVTNFVMEETGQPLHAFDGDKLPECHIFIRSAAEGEKIVTLNHNEYELDEDAVVICDGPHPVAIAGIMGGLQSGISNKTNTVILEAAQFNPSRIRKTSRKLGLRSSGSARHENQIDPAAVRYALDRAAALIQEVAGGYVLKGAVSQSPKTYLRRFVTARLSRINSLLGTKLSLSEVESFLNRLGMASNSDGKDLFQIRIPSYRNDIHQEIDIVEEVARIYGFNQIEKNRPRHVNSTLPDHPLFVLEKEVRARLVSRGLQEFITCNLISPELCDMELENGLFSPEYIRVLHAKSVDQSVLRPSLLPGLLSALKHNQNHGTYDISAFEMGRVHFKEGDNYEEKSALGILLAGRAAPLQWKLEEEEVDFYDLKGKLEDLATLLLLPTLDFEESKLTTFHPGRQAALVINDDRIGVMGEVHPASIEKLGIRGRVLFCEIDLLMLEKYRQKQTKFTELPQFPSSERDLTLTMKKSQSLRKIFDQLNRIDEPLLKHAGLIDIFEGEKIGSENKNVTFRFIYRHDDKTVDFNEVDKAHAKIVKTLERLV